MVVADPDMFHGRAASWFNPMLQLLMSTDQERKTPMARPIVLVESADRVPRDIGAIVHLGTADGNLLEVVGPPRQIKSFEPDFTTIEEADTVARNMAAIRYLRPIRDAGLPEKATLFESLRIERPGDLDCQSAWGKMGPLDRLTAPIGLLEDGSQMEFSLGEKGFGYHGLVAGTTGSGKSELLQSIVAALATRYSPEYLSFILVDFKGGAMARPFRNLPHLAGTISNLDKHMTRRVLTTLRAENERRQRVLVDAGVNKIDEYQELYRLGKVAEPLPRIVIVVDEFAELKRSEPEFLDRFVQIAALGRSLGLHLILATQKPSGIVTDQIRANTSYYLCLRVQSAEDSKEMLKVPDAALVPNSLPGRCYLRVGEAESLRVFQSAYAGAKFKPAAHSSRTMSHQVHRVALDGSRHRGAEIAAEVPRVSPSGDSSPLSQLEVLVDYIAETAKNSGLASTPSLWTPPLPEHMLLEDLKSATIEEPGSLASGGDQQSLSPVIGRIDDPANFAQQPYALPIGEKGHVAIYGAPGTGKTTLLQTLVTSLSLGYPVDRVNIYVLDFGGYRLKSLADLPHVGAVVLPDEDERVNRLTRFLVRTVDDRNALIAGAGTPSLSKYRALHSDAPPDVVVVINNYREF
ncbi:MAG: hypothetical protein IT335_05245, partial [Thermomicrobiales bacterium]|nr:hypothetical protein [Thermomicrobiales bacterium]